MPESPRIRRLRTDLRVLEKLRAESTILDFMCQGDPPESYLITFHGRGLFRPDGTGEVTARDHHQVAIRLGASYPRMMPELSWKTPVFHPNISGSGVVCLGGYGTYWVPSLNLDELCCMLWDMIRYQNFDVESPYNREAAQWTRTQGTFRLPVDNRFLRDKLASAPREPTPQPTLEPIPTITPVSSIPIAQPAGSTAAPIPTQPTPPEEEVIFLDEPKVVESEAGKPDDPDILFIE